MNVFLVKGVSDFIRKDACRETGDKLLGLVQVGCMQDVRIYKEVVSEHCQLEGMSVRHGMSV